MTPKFFTIRDNSVYYADVPWPMSFSAPLVEIREPCSACGRKYLIRRGEGVAGDIRPKGRPTGWPDMLGQGEVGGGLVMMSQRVIDGLQEANIRSFDYYPVQISDANVSKIFRIKQPPQPPRYYYIVPHPAGWLDHTLGGNVLDSIICPLCKRKLEVFPETRQSVPIVETSPCPDVFDCWNYLGSLFCTEKVLLLARQHRWTNFRFDAADKIRRHSYGWRGIDYLGEAWPPKWYPDPPSRGRTMAEWIEEIRVNRFEMFYGFDAIVDFGQQAVPPLLDMLRGDDPWAAWNAARAIYFLNREWPIQMSPDDNALAERLNTTPPGEFASLT